MKTISFINYTSKLTEKFQSSPLQLIYNPRSISSNSPVTRMINVGGNIIQKKSTKIQHGTKKNKNTTQNKKVQKYNTVRKRTKQKKLVDNLKRNCSQFLPGKDPCYSKSNNLVQNQFPHCENCKTDSTSVRCRNGAIARENVPLYCT